jgi:DNA-binding CsgD family transcriptional regulator
MRERRDDYRLAAMACIVAIQALAAVFFAADAIADIVFSDVGGLGTHEVMELFIAFSLVAGVVTGLWFMRSMLAKERRQDGALAVAKGAIARLAEDRFARWGLTAAESEVALFAMKGCNVTEIAKLRQSANGTVRAQLSRVYAKAGVSGQAALVSLFLDELLDMPREASTD